MSKLDETTLDTTNIVDHFDDYEFFTDGTYDIAAAPDSGAIILIGYYGYFFDVIAWILKVDSEGQEEWYQECSYET